MKFMGVLRGFKIKGVSLRGFNGVYVCFKEVQGERGEFKGFQWSLWVSYRNLK